MNGIVSSLLGAAVAGAAAWGTLWWRLGKVEGKMNEIYRQWKHLQARCPLCTANPGDKSVKGGGKT